MKKIKMQKSLRKNIIWSYISRIYLAVCGILFLPFYISLLGSESYALVALFATMQATFVIMDFGLSPTISREAAKNKAGIVSNLELNQLYASLNILFLLVCFVFILIFLLNYNFILFKWLQTSAITTKEIGISLSIMMFLLCLQLLSGLQKGIITGNEHHDWLSKYNIFFSTIKNIGAIILLIVFPTIVSFFCYQLLVGIIKYAVIRNKAKQLLPKDFNNDDLKVSLKPVKKYLNISISIFFSGVLLIIALQIDKILISNLLSMDYLGELLYALTLSNGIIMLSWPISAPLMPRLVKLNAKQEILKLKYTYLKSTQLISITSGTMSLIFYFYGDVVLKLWFNNLNYDTEMVRLFSEYSLGYFFFSISVLPYYIQYAVGNLKIHIISFCIFILSFASFIIYCVTPSSISTLSTSWLILNILTLAITSFFVHSKILLDSNVKWIFFGVLKPLALPVIFLMVIKLSIDLNEYNDIVLACYLIMISLVSLLLSVFLTEFKNDLRNFYLRLINN